MTKNQCEFVEAIEHNTKGLEAVSTGICPGCEQCRDEYGIKVPCHCKDSGNHPDCQECLAEDCETCAEYCDLCDGKGERVPTMEEFEEQWSNGEVFDEGSFSRHGCDLCNSRLGNTFEVWHAVDTNGKIIHGERACVDCVVYLVNGDLPRSDYD